MEIFDIIKNRRSIRKYKSQSVSKEDILKILDAANWAPSASNRQPWEFIVISGEYIKQLGDSYKGIAEEIIRKTNREDDDVITNNDFVKFAATYGGAPIVIVALVEKSDNAHYEKMDLLSASAAMENLILAASGLGLGTCWMLGPILEEVIFRKILDIPNDKDIIGVTPLGYPDMSQKPIPRLDPELKNKVRWLE